MRICFVCPNAYDLIARAPEPRHCGGAERQVELLARSFARLGHEVSVIVWDWGADQVDCIDGIRIIKTCRRDRGVPWVRFFHPRWSSLHRALGEADADLYYQNLAGYPTGQVALWCRQNRRRFVFSIASNPDTDPRLPQLRTVRERVLYRYGLRRADLILAQTETQITQLQSGFGYDATLMPMLGAPLPQNNTTCRQPHEGGPARVLWVGRIVPEKRLEWLLDAVEKSPDVQFDVVGPVGSNATYTESLTARARSIENVILHGRVAAEKLTEFYRRAHCLCCTSHIEGFPNTFLEAWAVGLPIVTTFDPDRVVEKHELGFVATDVDGLVEGLSLILSSAEAWRRASENAKSHYIMNHAVDQVVPRIEATLAGLSPKE